MLSYVLRRLMLMVPTLFGITFLVFSLLALAPGGIGAGLAVSGGSLDATKLAQMQAYLEDRYGLNDPLVVQYVRWLERLSPVKFGRRDLATPIGERLQPPRPIRPPPLPEWFPPPATSTPTVERGAIYSEAEREDAQRVFRRAQTDAIRARNAYAGAIKELELELLNYARDGGIDGVRTNAGKVRWRTLAGMEPDRSAANWPAVEAIAVRMHAAHADALATRATLDELFRRQPFPPAGVGIVPGVLWVDRPDLGVSYSRNRPVADLIGTALPVTLLLNLIAFPIIYLVAIPTGMLAAARRGTWIDVGTGGLFVALWSIPTVWAGVMAIGFLSNPQYLGLFPVSGLHDRAAEMMTFLPSRGPDGAFERGWLLDLLWHLVLPVACLVYGGFAVLAKQTRAAMLENFNADYVRTAKAKGVDRRTIVLRHVFRNSLLPLITMFVTVFPATLAGSVVIERIFSVPGMGSLVLDAINLRDRELILANTFMIACVNLVALLIADLLYALADPRVSFE